jgi:hypothetical protein
LLDGSLQNGSTTAATVSGAGVAAGMVVDDGFEAGLYNIEVETVGIRSTTTIAVNMAGLVEGEIVNISLESDIELELTDGADETTLLRSGGIVTFTASGNSERDTATAVNMLRDVLNISLGEHYDVTSAGNNLTVTAIRTGDRFDITGLAFDIAAVMVDGEDGTVPDEAFEEIGESLEGVDAVVNFN